MNNIMDNAINNSNPYRPCVGIMLLSKNGKVLVGKRLDNPNNYWQMPQGGIDEGEDALNAARRELLEETSVTSAKLLHWHDAWLYYDLPDELRHKIWNGRYAGQKQIWFCFAFEGGDAEINIASKTPEFGEWKWLDIESLPNVIVPFKQRLYTEVVNIFRPVQAKFLQNKAS